MAATGKEQNIMPENMPAQPEQNQNINQDAGENGQSAGEQQKKKSGGKGLLLLLLLLLLAALSFFFLNRKKDVAEKNISTPPPPVPAVETVKTPEPEPENTATEIPAAGLSESADTEDSGHAIVPVNLYNMPVLFFFDTAKPHAEYADYIYSYVRKYKEEGNGRKILIEGFSCDYGTEEHNEDLSKMRAGYVRSEFIKAGIPAGNIQIKYYGKSRYPKMGYGLRKYYWRAQVSLK